jgi:hypothetical protein
MNVPPAQHGTGQARQAGTFRHAMHVQGRRSGNLVICLFVLGSMMPGFHVWGGSPVPGKLNTPQPAMIVVLCSIRHHSSGVWMRYIKCAGSHTHALQPEVA